MSKKSHAQKLAAARCGATNQPNNPAPAERLIGEQFRIKTPEPRFETKLGWFFATNNNRLRYGDNREIVVGETHESQHEPLRCASGLHAANSVFYALNFAPGSKLYRVSVEHALVDLNYWFYSDKFVGRKRTYIATVDAGPILEKYSRDILLDYLNYSIKKEHFNVNADIKAFLETGLEAEHTLNHLTAIDLNNEAERAFIDMVWSLIQAYTTTNGYAKMRLLKDVLNSAYYLSIVKDVMLYENLDKVFLDAMGLKE